MLVTGMLLLGGILHAQEKGRRPPQDDGAPKAGARAPDFRAKVMGEDAHVSLQEKVAEAGKPVVLLFGSYT